MAEKGNRIHRLSFVGFGLLVTLPGCWPPIVDRWTVIEITDAASNTIISGATLMVSGTVELDPDYDPIITVAPTDELGRTLIPTTAYVSDANKMILSIRIQHDDRQEVIQVRNLARASTRGEHFRVRILDTDALAPEPPRMLAITGSNPPMIEIQGYAGTFVVCSNALRDRDRATVWRIWTETRYYIDERIVVDTVAPAGFVLRQPSDHCFAPTSEFREGFTAYSIEVNGNTYSQGPTYCLDETDAVSDCRANGVSEAVP